MNKQLFKQLCINYNRTADKDLFELWEYNLRPYEEEEIKKAFSLLMSKDKYFPNLNRILEAIKEVVNKEQINNTHKIEKLSKIKPKWYKKEIINLEVDRETIKEDEEFKMFLEEFRSTK